MITLSQSEASQQSQRLHSSLASMTNQRPVSRSRDHSQPIRGFTAVWRAWGAWWWPPPSSWWPPRPPSPGRGRPCLPPRPPAPPGHQPLLPGRRPRSEKRSLWYGQPPMGLIAHCLYTKKILARSARDTVHLLFYSANSASFYWGIENRKRPLTDCIISFVNRWQSLRTILQDDFRLKWWSLCSDLSSATPQHIWAMIKRPTMTIPGSCDLMDGPSMASVFSNCVLFQFCFGC